jgi:hypothetical protein
LAFEGAKLSQTKLVEGVTTSPNWIKFYTPRGLIFLEKVVSTVKDDLGMDLLIIENFNLIVKLEINV